jgi:hypothetical protein
MASGSDFLSRILEVGGILLRKSGIPCKIPEKSDEIFIKKPLIFCNESHIIVFVIDKCAFSSVGRAVDS